MTISDDAPPQQRRVPPAPSAPVSAPELERLLRALEETGSPELGTRAARIRHDLTSESAGNGDHLAGGITRPRPPWAGLHIRRQ